MASNNATRRASGARGGARGRVSAVIHPGQLSCAAGLPHLDGDSATAVRRFAESAFSSCPGAEITHDDSTPVLYTHDGCGFRVAPPRQILEQAQRPVSAHFHRNGPLIDQPHVVRALLQVRLAAHPRVVFAALFLDRHLRLIDFAEFFTGTVDQFVIHPREVIREGLRRNAESMVVARNDPTGDNKPSQSDIGAAIRLRHALAHIDIRLLDYLVVSDTITSLAERGVL